MSKQEIIDENGHVIGRPMSKIEEYTSVTTYDELTTRIMRQKFDSIEEKGDGKTYSTYVGRDIWKTVILATKPLLPKTQAEESTLASIYKILYSFMLTGEYPLLQQLCNYLGVTLDEFFAIMGMSGHPDREVYLWAYNVFESAATMNAVRSNGNSNMRVWLDKSREHKIAAEDRIELAIEQRKIDRLEKQGADIAREMIEE